VGGLGKRIEVTCDDCYFRRTGLCALQLERPCPTFRRYDRGTMMAPRQAPLIARPAAPLAAAQHVAA
jgi:hypothetical protein